MPLFSIIIPVYNVQNYLSACVKSVVEQPGPRDWECILVDDGSTDQSGAMCDALAAELPGLKVIHRETAALQRRATPASRPPRATGCCFSTVTTPWPPACWRSCAVRWPPTRTATGSSADISNGSPTAR